ncbi:type II secretion system F family protein [Marinobacter fonticola]|uniref:type II secretion system F family protein n=1 Tax=Marinobacter fonticola TaxID=2603215 RepID=UPI0011E7C4D5|nr:type II secretion system F family protein [Marinobacter fonticola]
MSEIIILLLAGVVFIYSARFLYRHFFEGTAKEEAVIDLNRAALPKPNAVRQALRVLNINLDPLLFFAGLLLIATTVTLVFQTLFPDRTGLAAIAGLSVLPAAGVLIRDLIGWRGQRFEAALVDVIDLVIALTASGASTRQSIETAAKGSPRYVREPLLEIVTRLKLGDSIDNATRPLLRLYRTAGTRLFVMTLISRWHDGANFESLLEALGSALRQRRTTFIQMRGQLSGAKYALLFSAGLPYVLIPFFTWREPEWLAPLTAHPQGPAVVYAAILCQVTGFMWMRRILRKPTW